MTDKQTTQTTEPEGLENAIERYAGSKRGTVGRTIYNALKAYREGDDFERQVQIQMLQIDIYTAQKIIEIVTSDII